MGVACKCVIQCYSRWKVKKNGKWLYKSKQKRENYYAKVNNKRKSDSTKVFKIWNKIVNKKDNTKVNKITEKDYEEVNKKL